MNFRITGLIFIIAQAYGVEMTDRIEVTGQVPPYLRSVSKVLPQQQVIDETSFSSDSLATLLSQSPAINLNGQGGLFQTINIRGFARWRIQTLVEGIPIYTERRAGTSVEFLPPAFVGQAFITQGAASTQLGSGAIGGGIDLGLSVPQINELQMGFGQNQDYRDLLWQGSTSLNSSEQKLSWQINHRQANNSEDGNNQPIQDRFEQNSITLRYSQDSSFIQEGLLLYSSSNNIAKASADLPQDRDTLYPENIHWLGKLTFNWHNAAVYFHDSNLITHVNRPGRRQNQLQNKALDLGFQLNDSFDVNQWVIHWRTGIDGRTGVQAFETELNNQGVINFEQAILDAEQWESFVAFDGSRLSGNHQWSAGGRLAYLTQEDKASNLANNDANLSAFVGYAYGLNNDWKISAYISSAYRVPSLTERYFNGTTPRGTTLGDPNLDTENAINTDISIDYHSDNKEFTLSIFHQEIDHYIERLTINDELRQYRNLDSAQVQGVNYQMKKTMDLNDGYLELALGGQWLWGEDNSNNPVADISPAQHRLTLRFVDDEHSSFIAMTHREATDELVAGELPTDKVTTIDAGLTFQLTHELDLSLNITNLTDQLFVTSRDDLAPFARGRDVHMRVTYRL